jgi:hypothetical protein
MNRARRPLATKLRKKMSKAIRDAQSGMPDIRPRKTSPELTAAQMLREYPNRAGKNPATAVQRELGVKKAQAKAATSKRTNPGAVPSDSPPAHPHREGKRWIKVLTKQMLAKRTVETRTAKKK